MSFFLSLQIAYLYSPEGFRTQYRARRSLHRPMICEDSSAQTACCRFPLVIDFAALGLNNILVPTTFNANYCAGECNWELQQFTIHGQLLRGSANDKYLCCSPSSLEGLTVMVYDHITRIVSIRRLPRMIVNFCKCG